MMENIQDKKLLAVNYLAILILLYKISLFIAEFQVRFFDWWLPHGKIFSYIHYYVFFNLFVVPVPFGVYIISLILQLLVAIFLVVSIKRNRSGDQRLNYFVYLILLAALGNWIWFNGD